MSGIIEFLVGYLILLICWLIVNLFFYALTVITRRSFFSVPFSINILLNWAIQIYFIIYPLYFIWQIISANWGDWLSIAVSLVIGLLLLSFFMGLWQMVVSLFVYPIAAITIYFSEKASEKLNTKEENLDYEIISPKGETISKFQSWDKTQKQLAKWFVISFVIAFINQFVKSNYGEGLGFGWYLIIPTFVLLLSVVVISFFLGIYNLLKKRGFLGGDKYTFLTKALKIYSIIYGVSLLFELLVRF